MQSPTPSRFTSAMAQPAAFSSSTRPLLGSTQKSVLEKGPTKVPTERQVFNRTSQVDDVVYSLRSYI